MGRLNWHADTAEEALSFRRLDGKGGKRSSVRTSQDKHESTFNRREGDSGRQTPEQKWRARRGTSEPWECPVGAREASSSAGCWCSPAVVQPCSLSHPRPASYMETGENVIWFLLVTIIRWYRTVTRWCSWFVCLYISINRF